MAAMEDRKPNPKLLVTWAIAGALLAASTWFLSFIPVPRLHANGCGFGDVLWMNRLRFLVFFLPFAIGIAVSLSAERRFNRGFLNGIWSEAQLEPVRALLAKPVWSTTAAVLAVAIVVEVIYSAKTSHLGGGAFIYLLLFPNQTATRIRQLITPKVQTTSGLIGWHNFKPIQSDQWGQPPIHSSE
jgi:hypothetical protein